MDWDHFRYWVDKYGIDEAVKDYAPEAVRNDPVVVASLIQMQIAELALRARLKQLMPNIEG